MREADATTNLDATAELTISERSGLHPALRDDLRGQLPGLEPDRRVTDWGRSERIDGLVDRTLYEFLYRYWFRVEVEGIENVPDAGPALLLANHSGALPSDAAMIAKAVGEEHPRPRPVQLATERQLAALPGLGMLATKLGAVAAHPANLRRLLFDEEQLVLGFPEGSDGARKPLRARYRVRSFTRHELVGAAIEAGAPIVPVALVGAEEAAPVVARLGLLRRLPSLTLAPPLPLPAKFTIRFLEPVDTGALPAGDERHARALGDEIRALIQEHLLELVAGRRSVWLG